MKQPRQKYFGLGLLPFFLISLLLLGGCGGKVSTPEKGYPLSDHYNGEIFINPGSTSPTGEGPKRGVLGWIWHWVTGEGWPEWPEFVEYPLGATPPTKVAKGTIRVTFVTHSTFLIQMDGYNILTDPIWSERCSPVSWAGPKRHTKPGLDLDTLPPIDAVLISHNHFDHLDAPTLKKLAAKGNRKALVPLGTGYLVTETGFSDVDELDWWQTIRIGPDLTITMVQAQHFSSRGLYDRNKALWGGFVISGPSGNVYFAGDNGYGPHFKEIARRFPSIQVAMIPISPYQSKSTSKPTATTRMKVHMGPNEAVQAHLDVGAQTSIAAHLQTFQLGPDTFFEAVEGLAKTLKDRQLPPDSFISLNPGVTKEWHLTPTGNTKPDRTSPKPS